MPLVPRARAMFPLAIAVLLLVAAWLFLRDLLAVPPGLEMDELIEGQIADRILGGDWRPFFPDGQGREALYHYGLAGVTALLGQSVFTLRLTSVMATLLGLAGWTALWRQLFGPRVALLTLLLSATSFWVLFGARSGLRSAIVLPASALFALAVWRATWVGGHRHWALAGLLMGLALYGYTAARVLPLAFGLFVGFLAISRRRWWRRQRVGVVMASIALALAVAPLLLYLQAHPEADQFDFLEFNRPLAALQAGDPQPALETTLGTLGMFTVAGDPLIFDNVPGRPVFVPGWIGGVFYLGLALALWRWRWPAYAFVLIWLPVALIPGMLSQPAPNFYRTVLAQPVTFVFPALAVAGGADLIERHLQRDRRRTVPGGLYLLLGGLLMVAQLRSTWHAYFETWPAVEGIAFFWQEGLANAARTLDADPADAPVAVCTILTQEDDPWWRPAWQSMAFLLQRSDLAIRYYDCRTTRVLLPDPDARYLFPELPASEVPEFARLDALAGTVVRYAPESGGGEARLPVRFGDGLALLGYEANVDAPGQVLRLVTHWQVLETPPPRLALFSHLMRDPFVVATQQDGLPVTAHSLRSGDRLAVIHDRIPLPAELSGEPWLLAIGLYSQADGARLPLARGDRLFLAPIAVEGGP